MNPFAHHAAYLFRLRALIVRAWLSQDRAEQRADALAYGLCYLSPECEAAIMQERTETLLDCMTHPRAAQALRSELRGALRMRREAIASYRQRLANEGMLITDASLSNPYEL